MDRIRRIPHDSQRVVDTLARWETRRIGPPCASIGLKVLYRAAAFREWLVSRERHPVSKGARLGGE